MSCQRATLSFFFSCFNVQSEHECRGFTGEHDLGMPPPPYLAQMYVLSLNKNLLRLPSHRCATPGGQYGHVWRTHGSIPCTLPPACLARPTQAEIWSMLLTGRNRQSVRSPCGLDRRKCLTGADQPTHGFHKIFEALFDRRDESPIVC